jgi:hypothetical protein
MKRIFAIILSTVLLLTTLVSCGVPNQADDAVLCKDADGNYYALSADGKTFLYYYPGNESESFTVPEGVEIVAKNAFRDASNLKELNFSTTVRTIEDGTFELSHQERIVIPATVEHVKYDFFNCPNLKELVCEAPMEIFNAVGCIALESIVLPQTVTGFDAFCFDGCPEIASIRVSGQSKAKDAALEAACAGKVLYIPEGITEVLLTQLLSTGAEGFYIPDSVAELDLRGTGSWGRSIVVSVNSETTVLTDGDEYHTIIVR